MNEIVELLCYEITRAKALVLIGESLSNEHQLNINKLMCDYNEALKKESNGK